jgi:tetratricopeptide (TPR) repeat protein
MADAIEQRDFFISFNSADLAYAEAINSALRAAGFTTFFHPKDIDPGGNIPLWMEDALMNSRQLLALCTPEYMAEGAVYSESERYARFWQDTRGAKFKLVPVELRPTMFKPLMSVYKRIDVKGMAPADAAKAVVAALKKPDEVQQREVLRTVEPLPKIFNVLYRHNPNFTGRLEAMESLQKSLRDGNAAITALAGMGGVGKTTLAAEYCHRFGGRYGGVWWVRAEQEPVMLADLAALGQRIGIAVTGNIEADARAALETLAARGEPWLMVYDNAPNADALAKWLPAGAVRCLITSRFTGFDNLATVTPLDRWSDEVTSDYLLVRTARDDKGAALRLAHALGGLPVAAEQAAVFLKDRKGITFDAYAADIPRLIKRRRDAGASGDYPDTVYASFAKSLESLGGRESGKTALDILRVCSFLSPDGVDLGLLAIDKDGKVLPADFGAGMADTFAREDALAALASLSLLRQENGPAGPVLIFHRLLLEVVRDWMGAEARDLWGGAAVRLVDRAFPSDASTNPSHWPLCARLMPHVARLEAYAPRTDMAGKALGRVLNQACVYLYARGDRTGALALAKKAVEFGRGANVEPLILATRLGNLAGRYSDLERLDEAEATCREALAIEEPRLDPHDPSLAITLSNLAGVQWKRKQFAETEPLYLRAAEIMKAAHGAESAEYGTLLSNLGTLYSDWADEPGQSARRAQEEEYKTQALAVTRAARGMRHPSTAVQCNNLAVMKAKRGDWAGAAADAEQAVAIMLSLDLALHPSTQLMAIDLATYTQHCGHHDKAARLAASDISDLLPVIAQIEAEHRVWVAEDPKIRYFGPPSHRKYGAPQIEADSAAQLIEVLAQAGVDVESLARRIEAGELTEDDFKKIVADAVARSQS